MLKVGDSAPDFTATTHEGKQLTLSSLRGHKVPALVLSKGRHARLPRPRASGSGIKSASSTRTTSRSSAQS
jgi:hypothetical protein